MSVASQALQDAQWNPESEEEKHRAGVAIGAGIGNVQDIVEAGHLIRNKVNPHGLSLRTNYILMETTGISQSESVFYSPNLDQFSCRSHQHRSWT